MDADFVFAARALAFFLALHGSIQCSCASRPLCGNLVVGLPRLEARPDQI